MITQDYEIVPLLVIAPPFAPLLKFTHRLTKIAPRGAKSPTLGNPDLDYTGKHSLQSLQILIYTHKK